MVNKFKGKKLLILGSNVGALDIIAYAKENGAYTIAVDNLEPNKSEAKLAADKHYLISTGDINRLNELIRDEKIDAILAGISEFNLIKAMQLSEENGLNFYCSQKQWEMIESKECFRKLCLKHHVPCPETYYCGIKPSDDLYSSLPFPLVLKPVDASSSSGVHICHNINEVQLNMKDSLSFSEKKKVIIEEFIHGDEFTAHYVICNGKAALSCIDNRYPTAIHEGDVTTIPIARIYPSTYLEQYMTEINPYMIELCESIGLQNAILFIQGFYDNEKDRIVLFEAGLRCAGEAPYRFISRLTGNDFMHMIVDHGLLGTSDYSIEDETPYLNGKLCGVVSFATTGGRVGEIIHLEETVKMLPEVIAYENRYPEGSDTPSGDSLRQLMMRFVLICRDRQHMVNVINKLNKEIIVKDIHHQNMVKKFDPERLFSYEKIDLVK